MLCTAHGLSFQLSACGPVGHMISCVRSASHARAMPAVIYSVFVLEMTGIRCIKNEKSDTHATCSLDVDF